MFIDANQLSADHELRSEVVIIGAGAAGIPAAAELAKAGISVLLVESGGFAPSKDANQLSAGTVGDTRHGSLSRYRERVFGGTTRVWGGRVAPLDEVDLMARDHIGSKGWPLSRQDLDPHYVTAHHYLHVGAFDYDANSSQLTPTRPVAHEVALSSHTYHQDMIWRFSNPVDLGKEWRRDFGQSATVTVALNATCVELTVTDEGTAVRGCKLRSLSGTPLSAVASVIVLAAGGLETTRLLLNTSSERYPTGLGNQSGLLGRYYSSHLAGLLGPLHWAGTARLVGMHYERDPDGVYVRRTLSLRPQRQLELGLLNFRAMISSPSMSDPSHGSAVLSAGYLAKRYFLRRIPPEYDAGYGRAGGRRLRAKHMRNVVTHLPELLGFAPWWVSKRIIPVRKIPSMEVNPRAATFHVHFDAEQTPLRTSTVSLGEGRDRFGSRSLHVDWRVQDSDITTLIRSYSLLADELASAGIAQASPPAGDIAERVSRELGVGSHHIGTTRMSASPRDGVTDPACRVRGLSNLFVASSSVFPTAGVANPTLTIVALAIRVARTIVRDLGRS